MKFIHLKEHAQDTARLVMLVVVVIVSTASTVSLNPRTMADINKQSATDDSVKGISTLDSSSSGAVRFEQFIGIMEGVTINNFHGQEQNYLSKILVSHTAVSTLDQGIVKISNDSKLPKQFKLTLRSDPSTLINYNVKLKVDSQLVPLDLFQYGFVESTFIVNPGEMSTIGLHIQTQGYGFVQNLGFEMELAQL